MAFECFCRRGLDLRDDLDRLLHKGFTFVFRYILENFAQLIVAQILLNDDANTAVHIVNLRDRESAFEKQPRDIQVRLHAFVKCLGINCRDSGPAFPRNAKVDACRCVRRQSLNGSIRRPVTREIFFEPRLGTLSECARGCDNRTHAAVVRTRRCRDSGRFRQRIRRDLTGDSDVSESYHCDKGTTNLSSCWYPFIALAGGVFPATKSARTITAPCTI